MATAATAPPRAPDYRAVAVQSAQKYGINPALFLRQIQHESGFNPHARSPAGAVGIAQIVPRWHPGVNATDPIASLDYAAKYMATLVHKYGNYQSALSVYNSGNPNAYKDPGFSGGQTHNYVNAIMGGASGAVPAGAPSLVAPPRSPAAAGGLSPALMQAMSRMNALLGMPAIPAGLFRGPPVGRAPLPGLGGGVVPPTVPYAPGKAGGFLNANAPYTPGRLDAGHDFQTAPGEAIRAPGDGYVVRIGYDPAGFGPRYPIVHFTSGPYAGKDLYVGHTLATVAPGQRFKTGQVLSRTGTRPVGNASVPGWAEIGYARGGSPGEFGQTAPF